MAGEKYYNIEENLYSIAQEINSTISCDTVHCYRLRRALLNSRFFHANIFIRFYYRVIHKNKKLLLYGSTFCAGICTIIVINSYFDFQYLYKKLVIQSDHVERVFADQVSNQKVQSLYRYGYLEYSHQNVNGDRVFKTNEEIKKLEVIDKEPYIINLVLAD